MPALPPQKVLIVCLGNICRSPTAEAVLRAHAGRAGLHLEIDSAGTADYHIGNPPDKRSIQHALNRGYAMANLRARRVKKEDFERFDLILAADKSNLADLRRQCPPQHSHKLHLFLGERDIPDPYHGEAPGFESVLDLVEGRCSELIALWTDQGTSRG
jgi:protein-tyrosine phosphatase